MPKSGFPSTHFTMNRLAPPGILNGRAITLNSINLIALSINRLSIDQSIGNFFRIWIFFACTTRTITSPPPAGRVTTIKCLKFQLFTQIICILHYHTTLMTLLCCCSNLVVVVVLLLFLLQNISKCISKDDSGWRPRKIAWRGGGCCCPEDGGVSFLLRRRKGVASFISLLLQWRQLCTFSVSMRFEGPRANCPEVCSPQSVCVCLCACGWLLIGKSAKNE